MVREIGGSSFALWRSRLNNRISECFKKRADRLHKIGSKTIISNPSCRFINHCTIIFHFTVNNTEKYQLINQGKYIDRFKNWNRRMFTYCI